MVTQLHCDRENAHSNLYSDYFSNNYVYGERELHHRFRMSQELFFHIVDAITQHDNYFHQKRIASSRMGLLTLQKITAAIQILAYSVLADTADKYIKIGEYTRSKEKIIRSKTRSMISSRYWKKKILHDIMTTCII